MRAVRWEVRWDGEEWVVWRLNREVAHYPTKVEAEEAARVAARAEWEANRQPGQLFIYTKRGRIGKGGRYEASYGCDSRRRRG